MRKLARVRQDGCRLRYPEGPLVINLHNFLYESCPHHKYTGKILDEFATARSKGFDNGHQLSEFVLASICQPVYETIPNYFVEFGLSTMRPSIQV